MSIVQLNETYLRALKRALQSQCDVPSARLTEAMARGVGFRTNAALQDELKSYGGGHYVRFNEPAFRERLGELSGGAPEMLGVPPLDHAARYIEKLYDDQLLEILELRPMRARFRLAGIETVIEITLDEMGDGYTRFRRSHAIHTPGQLGPYWPGREFDNDSAYAMHRAIESLAFYYRRAVRAGHRPIPSWLVQQA